MLNGVKHPAQEGEAPYDGYASQHPFHSRAQILRVAQDDKTGHGFQGKPGGRVVMLNEVKHPDHGEEDTHDEHASQGPFTLPGIGPSLALRTTGKPPDVTEQISLPVTILSFRPVFCRKTAWACTI